MNANPQNTINNKENNYTSMIYTGFISMLILILSGFIQIYGNGWITPEGEIIKKINDKTTLLEIVKNHTNINLRVYAASKLGDQSLLIAIAKNNKEVYEMRGSMTYRIKNQAVIADIALNDSDWRMRESAVNYLNDLTLLTEIEKNDKHREVRSAAATRPQIMRINYHKYFDTYTNFSALAQTNDIPPLSEAALYYLQEQTPETIIDDNNTQTSDDEEKVLITEVETSSENTPTCRSACRAWLWWFALLPVVAGVWFMVRFIKFTGVKK